MGIFNNLFLHGKDKEKGANYLDEAEQTAEIVETGAATREISEISKQLEDLPGTKTTREQFVFERASSLVYMGMIVCCIVLSALFLYFLALGVAVLTYSSQYALYGAIGFCGALTVIVTNIILLSVAAKKIQFDRRYEKYEDMLRYHNIILVDDLAAYAEIGNETVVKDLEMAIKKKYIPQGHFGRDNLIFLTSDTAYNVYQEKPAVYDRYYSQLLEDRSRMKQRTDEIQRIMDLGQAHVEKIHDCSEIIKDKNISHKILKMEKIVAMIFREVDVNPDQADKLGLFLDYYLPTTEKLLNAYVEIDQKQIKGKSLSKTKKDIESALDTINRSFEGILDKFYQDQEMDIASDISAMEIIMRQEGLISTE